MKGSRRGGGRGDRRRAYVKAGAVADNTGVESGNGLTEHE